MTTTLVVGTADLRQALTAVRVHACTDKEQPELHRIRLLVHPQNVAVVATDRFTMALAIASVWEDHGIAPCTVDLLPDDVTKILAIFKAGKESGGDDPEFKLRLDIHEQALEITDCSGLIDGRALRVPRIPADGGDTLAGAPGMIAGAHTGAISMLADMTVNGDSLARFKVAANAYHAPVTIESRRGMLLTRCGESFLGLMMPRKLGDGELMDARHWAEDWDRRLPGLIETARKAAEDDRADLSGGES
ncbi:hypothetical protein [Nocardia wallacei]|uniref:hypothetical protein n=1 Tax=Nocardia wallacei TaxID=480035 RepID=UPI002454FF08|nr:hypothetical protein [Nocardia wallacei]